MKLPQNCPRPFLPPLPPSPSLGLLNITSLLDDVETGAVQINFKGSICGFDSVHVVVAIIVEAFARVQVHRGVRVTVAAQSPGVWVHFSVLDVVVVDFDGLGYSVLSLHGDVPDVSVADIQVAGSLRMGFKLAVDAISIKGDPNQGRVPSI